MESFYHTFMENKVSNELLKRLQGGERSFIEELLTMIECLTRRWNWSDAENREDIAQECFLKLMRNLRAGKFKGTSSFKTYVYAIVRNTCIDYLKLEKSRDALENSSREIDLPVPLPDADLLKREERTIACKVLLSLPAYCRKLWRMIFFGKRSYSEAAFELGAAEGTVKRQMWQCRQKARELVKALEMGEPIAVEED